jgi:chromosome segregation ATPase
LTLLAQEGATLQKIKEQFDGLKKNLASEIGKVKGDLQELEKYEDLKNTIEAKISQQQEEFRKKIVEVENQITREEKRYADVIEKMKLEEKKIDQEKTNALSIRERENLIKQRLGDLRKAIETLETTIDTEDKEVVNTEEHISRLKGMAGEIIKSVESKKGDLDRLFAEGKEQEKKIIEMQASILAKAKEKKEEIDKRIAEGKGATKHFKTFFEKKAKVDQMLQNLTNERNELEKELINLIQKAKAFSIAAKTKNIPAKVTELKKSLAKIDQKKGVFEKNVRKFVSLLKK